MGYPEIQTPHLHHLPPLNIQPIPNLQHPFLPQLNLHYNRQPNGASPHPQPRHPSTRTHHAHHSRRSPDHRPMAPKDQPDHRRLLRQQHPHPLLPHSVHPRRHPDHRQSAQTATYRRRPLLDDRHDAARSVRGQHRGPERPPVQASSSCLNRSHRLGPLA